MVDRRVARSSGTLINKFPIAPQYDSSKRSHFLVTMMHPVSRPPNSAMQYEPDRPLTPFVSVGPVIGLVTDKTARILAEVSADTELQCYLMDEGGEQHGVSQRMVANKPHVFAFSGLSPDTRYKVSFNVPVPGVVKSVFRTVPSLWDITKKQARLAFVSGNKYSDLSETVDTHADLWKDVYKKARRGDIDYCIHMGNQVYLATDNEKEHNKGSDEHLSRFYPWEVAYSRLVGSTQASRLAQYEDILHLFRSAYRKAWSYPTTRHALANVPNLMIMNEADICPGFDKNVESDDSNINEFLSKCAYEVYNEYQRSLFEDYTPMGYGEAEKVGQAHHFHGFGGVGFMLLDTRAHRVFHDGLGGECRMLGERQWKDVDFALSPNGYFDNSKVLFIITPSPICHIGAGATKTLGVKKSPWSHPVAVPEASMLLSKVFDWRAAKAGQREIIFVSSGLGEGGCTDIVDLRYSSTRDRKLDRAKQIVAGNITAKGSTSSHIGHAMSRGMENHLGNHHQFSHFGWTKKKNFAVVNVYTEGDHDVSRKYRDIVFDFNHVVASKHHRKEKLTRTSKKRRNVCCGGWANPCGGRGKAWGLGTHGHAKEPRSTEEFQHARSATSSVSFTSVSSSE